MGDKSFAKEASGIFDKYNVLCGEAVTDHGTLMGFLLKDEGDKHEMWFKVKMSMHLFLI